MNKQTKKETTQDKRKPISQHTATRNKMSKEIKALWRNF